MPKLPMVTDGHLGGYIRGGDPGTWCPNLWSWVVAEFGVRSVLDVGCGEGHSAKFFRDRGCEVLGLEGCEQAIADSVIPDRVVRHDFCAGPYHPDRRYDLVWSCEFLEHVEARYLPNILATFAHAGKVILVTHAFPGQDDGHHHVNCRPSSFWIRQFESLGFTCDLRLTRQARAVTLRDYRGVNHFARSGLLFVRNSDAPAAASGWWASLGASLSARYRAFLLHHRFRLSGEFRRHVRKRRAEKRLAKRTVSS